MLVYKRRINKKEEKATKLYCVCLDEIRTKLQKTQSEEPSKHSTIFEFQATQLIKKDERGKGREPSKDLFPQSGL